MMSANFLLTCFEERYKLVYNNVKRINQKEMKKEWMRNGSKEWKLID